eukprot:TRINITY_DN24447_c0_g1_i1.p1 TRINITY_DN24447_c0_g1~~TRINITY_DN24447_c0_g1_i1.p1  ORF type:complete len:126 (-),score=8.38 TRINITY_DN24447_c0_g1_i1:137-514(-)
MESPGPQGPSPLDMNPWFKVMTNASHWREVVGLKDHQARVWRTAAEYCFPDCVKSFMQGDDMPLEPGERCCVDRCVRKFIDLSSRVRVLRAESDVLPVDPTAFDVATLSPAAARVLKLTGGDMSR